MHARSTFVALAVLTLTACGGSSSTGSNLPPGYYILISGLAFPAATLRVPAGATVHVVNQSTMAHTVTEEAAAGDFTLGGPAGVTPFNVASPAGSTTTFTVPTGLADGTVLHYFCQTHTSTMSPANGSITVDSGARTYVPPGVGGAGY